MAAGNVAYGLYSGRVIVNASSTNPDLAVPFGGPAVDPIVSLTSGVSTAEEILSLSQYLCTGEASLAEIVLELITEPAGQ